MRSSPRSAAFALLGAALAAALDQLSKFWLVRHLAEGETAPLLPFLSLCRTRNTGIAFSLLSSSGNSGLIALTAAIIGFVVFLFWRQAGGQKWAQLGYALILGGAIGNLIDRARLHYVVDFILFHAGGWSFAVFNLADAFITCGAAVIFACEFLRPRGGKTAK